MKIKMTSSRILSVVLALALLVSSMLVPAISASAAIEVWEGDIATGFALGTGTESDPFMITNGAELAYAVNNSAADTYYELANDIYLNDPDKVNWATGAYTGDAPNSWYKDIQVQGNFNGAGHVVYGLYYNGWGGTIDGTDWNSFTEAVALFPEINYGTTLTVTGMGIDKAYVSTKQGAGAFVGSKESSTADTATLDISECYVGSEVTLIGYDTGAFLAINRAVATTLTDCYSLASQTAASCNGLVTDNWGGSITMTRCYNGSGPLDSKNTATCKNSYATEAGGKGAIVLEPEKMTGTAAAENMTELASKYVTTAGTPALKLFMDELDPSVNITIETQALSEEANRELAREVVGEGVVMLKNSNNALPLSADRTVAFFGKGQNSSYFALGGGGSGNVYINYTAPGPAEVFAELAEEGKIGIYEPLYNAYMENTNYVPDTAMYEAASAEADTAVVVITRRNGEGYDMSEGNWYLTDGEKALLTNSTTYFENVIVLLNCTSVIGTDWSLDGNSYGIDVDALLVCNAPGEMGAYGIADIMLGDVNPSGKLADTYAMDITDYLSTDSYDSAVDNVEYTEDIYVGYRYFETFNIDVAYEFGFGMSYTTFDITTDSVTNDGKNITVTATVKNTGNVAGKEVVQVYYSAPQKGEGTAVLSKSSIDLAGFKKTGLIEPGKSETVTVTFAINDMASFDDVGYTGHRSCYVLEAGTYDIRVGNSVKNNAKQGEYTVSELTVVEETNATSTQLESRLEADGIYTDPSIPVLKDGQTFVKSDAVTVIEGEGNYKYDEGMKSENYTAEKGWITDGYSWYNIGAAGTIFGDFKDEAGDAVYYSFYVEEAGTYGLGFVTSNGNKAYEMAEDILVIDISADGGTTWTQAEGFSFDSPSTAYGESTTGYRWWNLNYVATDSAGKDYNVTLPAGEVLFRIRVTDVCVNGYDNTNIDKFMIIPEGVDYGLEQVFEAYGLKLKPVLTAGETLWVEAEDYSTAGKQLKQESFTGNGFFNTGSKYTAVSGTSVGTFHSYPGGSVYYDIIVEEAGTYNLGFISSDGNKNSYTAGVDGNDLFTIEYSTDGGTTFTAAESPAFDSINTYGAMTETGKQWFNFIYTTADKAGELYQVTLPAGAVTIAIKIAETVNDDSIRNVTNCNLDKFSISPASDPCTLEDTCAMYGIEYAEVINSTSAMWFEGESYTTTATRVNTENFTATQGYLHEGTVYASLPAGAVVGFFDKNTTGYAEYDLISEKAGKYNVGFTLGSGSTLAKNNNGLAPDVIDVLISSDGGTTWTKQFAIDVKYTGKDVTGTAAQYWNFYYSNTDFDGNQYQLNLPAGSFKMRIACNENSPVYGGANIDKFVIYPETMTYTEQNCVAYYFNTDDNTDEDTEDTELPDPIEVDFTTDNYVGITYADILAGNATWDELIAQMSLNEMIDLTYGKYGQWSYGYTGYIGFTDDATAEKYGIYAGDTADGGQGLRMEYRNTTYLPNATLQACTWNTELIKKLGEMVGKEALRNNADMWLAPGANIHRNPLCGRNFEYYSEDPVLSGLVAASMVNGVESQGVSCVVKHYAANNKEYNRKFSNSVVSEKALREIYLKSFEICIENSDPICIMSSYNMINGTYTSTDPWVLQTVLREEWGYTGLIMSDWTTTPDITPELNAGNNSKMLGSATDADEIRAAMTYGIVTREILEENTYWILTNLVKMPDNAINPNKVTELKLSGVTSVRTTEYSRKSQRARIVINNGIFDVPGTQGYFYEYKVDTDVAGTYALGVEYTALSAMDNAFEIYVNGELVDVANDLAATNSSYTTATLAAGDIELPAGESVIQIKHIGGNSSVNYRALSFDYSVTGDVNNDKTVTVCDLVYLEHIIAERYSETSNADVNGDGSVDALDAAELRKLLIA